MTGDNVSECPFCETRIPDTALDCQHCQNILPVCIYTGLFVPRNDFGVCPASGFPARYSAISTSADKETFVFRSPICPTGGGEDEFQSADIRRLESGSQEIASFLDGFSRQFEHGGAGRRR